MTRTIFYPWARSGFDLAGAIANKERDSFAVRTIIAVQGGILVVYERPS